MRQRMETSDGGVCRVAAAAGNHPRGAGKEGKRPAIEPDAAGQFHGASTKPMPTRRS